MITTFILPTTTLQRTRILEATPLIAREMASTSASAPAADPTSSSASDEKPASASASAPASEAVCVVCVGMAGSGKTTFMQRINAHLHGKKEPPYVINLDPAVLNVPFESNIDIRDSVNYHEVMKQYNLGPNGGILTSLNLFATKVDQILGLLEKRTVPDPENPAKKVVKNILVDTR